MKLRGRPWHWCLLLAGGAGVLGLFLSLAPANAQDKGKKNDQTKKEATKVEPKKPKAPEVRDIVIGSVVGPQYIKLINDTIEKSWQDNKLEPAERCSDYEFIRRASLDIIGRIAKVSEIDRFMKDPQETRRSMLIDRLLGLEKGPDQAMYAEEYAANWARIWSNMLLTRSGVDEEHHEQLRLWLMEELMEKRGSAKSDEFDEKSMPNWANIVAQLLSEEGTTNDKQAVNYILAHLGDAVPNESKGTYGTYDMVPVTSRTTRLFLGLRTQCVQCHDHPFNDEWGQHHFWGINAFFRQVEAPQGRLPSPGDGGKKKGVGGQRTLKDNSSLNAKGIIPYERRTGVFLFADPTFLDGKKMKKLGTDSTRRKELAKFITNSPYFGKAYVNRTWGHFLGKGLTKDQVDDFGEHNPVTYPELFEKISEDWAKDYRHNPKTLIRWICNSRPYGLSSVANKSNDKPEDEIFFSRMLAKSMSPEQLFESLITATDAKVGASKEARDKSRRAWLQKLVVNFGDDEGNEGSYNGTVVQALMLMNGKEMHEAINDKDHGTVATVLKKRAFSATAARDAVKDLFLAALNRPPRAEEYNRILSAKMITLPRVKGGADAQAFWTAYYQDIFWAILNSNEFILNH